MNSGLRTLVADSISQCLLSERGMVTMEKDSDEDYYDESMGDLVSNVVLLKGFLTKLPVHLEECEPNLMVFEPCLALHRLLWSIRRFL